MFRIIRIIEVIRGYTGGLLNDRGYSKNTISFKLKVVALFYTCTESLGLLQGTGIIIHYGVITVIRYHVTGFILAFK